MVDSIEISRTPYQKKVGYGQLDYLSCRQPVLTSAEVLKCRESLKEDLQVISTVSCESKPLLQAILRVSPDHVTLIRIVVGKEDEKADAIVIPTGRAICSHFYPIEPASLHGICGNSRVLKNTGRELVNIGEVAALQHSSDIIFIQTLFPLLDQISPGSNLYDRFVLNALTCAVQLNLGSITFPGFDTRTVKSIVNGLCSLGATSLHTVNIVLQTKLKANPYVTALRRLILNSTGSKATLPTPAGVIWYWKGDDGIFTAYSEADSVKIESMFQQKDKSTHITISKRTYRFDFNQMRQVSVHTGFKRDIQRVPLGQCNFKPVFLRGDEVVINIEGPRENITKARQQLEQIFRSLVLKLIMDGKYPAEWDPMSESDWVKVVPLPRSLEFDRVRNMFERTLSNKHVTKIQRVQNKMVWSHYKQSLSILHKKNAGQLTEMSLFHGTRDKPADMICRSEEGFDMRFSREGMWGQANYFAKNASYSDRYSHHLTDGTREMILASVLTGDSYSCKSDPSLRMPPEKPQHSSRANQLQQVRYDSVNGETNGSVVYMTYSNNRAYPAYIITYSDPSGNKTTATASTPATSNSTTATASTPATSNNTIAPSGHPTTRIPLWVPLALMITLPAFLIIRHH